MKLFLCSILLAFLAAGCAAPSAEPDPLPQTGDTVRQEAGTVPEQAENPAEKTDTEKQLDSFTAHMDEWLVEEEQDWWGYAVTDLDRDGHWEIISSEDHGTGHYSHTVIHEMDSDYELRQVSSEVSSGNEILQELAQSGGPLFCGPLIMPNLTSTGAAQKYTVFYDAAQDTYYYIYADSVKNQFQCPFTTLRAFSLRWGEMLGLSIGEEPSGVFLGYNEVEYHRETNYTSVEYWDMAGNYISSKTHNYGYLEEYISPDTFEMIADQLYSGLEEMEAQILWIEDVHSEDLREGDLYALLQQSMDSFSIEKPAASDS
ncbi:MAG: hypothetical protein K2O18_07480 [Oscillospiraceae bacterium]|nr:hypothetical protein [Oscillospiraceae bacterium]